MSIYMHHSNSCGETRNLNWEDHIYKFHWETYTAYNKVGDKVDSLHSVFVL